MKITAEMIEKFAAVRAQKNALEREDKELSEPLKKEMLAREARGLGKEYGPKDSRQKLVLIPSERVDVGWKEIAQELAKELWEAKWKSRLQKIVNSYGKKDVYSLTAKLNENFKEIKGNHNFEERVQRLMNRHAISRDEAARIVKNVIATKE